jgi:hypothetical protein
MKNHKEQLMAEDTMNCLRCRHCAPLPQTSFQPITVILCNKRNEVMTPVIFNRYGIADPRYRYQRRDGKFKRINGDRMRNASQVEIEFLRSRYATGNLKDLSQVTGRTIETIKCMAQRHHFPWRKRNTAHFTAAGKARRQAQGDIFNEEQSRVAHEYYLSGRWPFRGGSTSPERYAEKERLKAEIVEAVSAVGPPRTFTTILRHIQYRSPAYQRQQLKRRARRKAAQFAAR